MANESDGAAPLAAGDQAPGFTLVGAAGRWALAEALARGPAAVIFYREEGTPTCGAQLAAFVEAYPLIAAAGATALALSTDSPDRQATFAADLAAPFPLLADPDGAVARAYGVYDAAERRANRAVFVVAPEGRVTLAIPWFNPANSAQLLDVLAALGVEV